MDDKPVTHVIFDVDGTILDTESIYTDVFEQLTLDFAGQKFSLEVKQKMMGRHRLESLAIYKEVYNIPHSVEELDVAANSLLYERFPHTEMLPGVIKLIEHLYRYDIPMAVATGSDAESFSVKTAKWKDFFNKYFQHSVLTCDPEVKKGKPAPDVFLVAAKRFKTQPVSMDNVLVVEDALNGVDAALKAGMKCLYVPSVKLDTTTVDAHLTLSSLEDFKPDIFGLPPY